MSDDKMRAEFEKWAEDNDCGIVLARASSTGFYTRSIAWTAWQAAYAAGQKAEREAIFIEWENGELLAAEVERLRAEVEMSHSFHRVAVKERDFERLLVEALKEELAAAKAASVCPVSWKSAEQFFQSGADRGNQWGVELWFENKEQREQFHKWLKERGEG